MAGLVATAPATLTRPRGDQLAGVLARPGQPAADQLGVQAQAAGHDGAVGPAQRGREAGRRCCRRRPGRRAAGRAPPRRPRRARRRAGRRGRPRRVEHVVDVGRARSARPAATSARGGRSPSDARRRRARSQRSSRVGQAVSRRLRLLAPTLLGGRSAGGVRRLAGRVEVPPAGRGDHLPPVVDVGAVAARPSSRPVLDRRRASHRRRRTSPSTARARAAGAPARRGRPRRTTAAARAPPRPARASSVTPVITSSES